MGFRIVLCLSLLSFCLGCGKTAPQKAASKTPAATVDVVCDVAAELMNVKRDKVRPATTLGELGADELDVVELVMELEDRFDISIPDDSIEISSDSKNKSGGFSSTTMQNLATLVDKRRQLKSPSAKPSFGQETKTAEQ